MSTEIFVAAQSVGITAEAPEGGHVRRQKPSSSGRVTELSVLHGPCCVFQNKSDEDAAGSFTERLIVPEQTASKFFVAIHKLLCKNSLSMSE